MNYHDTMMDCMRCYPTLFATEDDVLHHLFFVNGNGYDWWRGQLVSPRGYNHSSPKRNYRALQTEELRYRRDMIEAYANRGIESHSFICPDGTIGSKIYPLCQFADILRVPPSVKPDWRDAAERALAWAFSPRARLTESDFMWLILAEDRLHNLKNE